MSERLAELKGAEKAEAKKRYGARLGRVRHNSKAVPIVPASTDAELASETVAPTDSTP